MAEVLIGDAGFTAIAAGDEITAEPLDAMFDRIKDFLQGTVTDATVKVKNYYADIAGIFTFGDGVSDGCVRFRAENKSLVCESLTSGVWNFNGAFIPPSGE